MKRGLTLATLAAAALTLAGCVSSPEQYESTPVQIQTDQGVVVCQLYTKERVLWDRSIMRPSGMSVEAADEICRDAGYKWQQQ